jgi:hypothetical protein
MRRKRYSVVLIVASVNQHELGMPAGDIARKLGSSEQTSCRWNKEYGALWSRQYPDDPGRAGLHPVVESLIDEPELLRPIVWTQFYSRRVTVEFVASTDHDQALG